MATYVESGLRVELPAGQHFRFADLPAYKPLSGQRLKEMDFAWIENGKLYLLEVRSYVDMVDLLAPADFVPAKDQPTPYRFQALIDKVTDSLLMMLAVWADTEHGGKIGASFPLAARARLPLKLIIAVDLPEHLVVHLQALRDSLNERLRGRISLADIGNIAVMDCSRLVSIFGTQNQGAVIYRV